MKLIAPRGSAGIRVENTLAAFENAIGLGADGAVLDVHLTRDGQVAVHHDARLNGAYFRHEHGQRLSRGDEPQTASLTYDQLRRYEGGVPDPAGAYARAFDRVEPVTRKRVPLLRDVIRTAKSGSERFVLVVEIKA